jgi:hypothetical protein
VVTKDEDGFLKVALIRWKIYSERCSKATNITKFRALFGIGPKSVLDVYDVIQTEVVGDVWVKTACATKCLTVLFWLKSYQTETVLATTTGYSRNRNRKYTLSGTHMRRTRV